MAKPQTRAVNWRPPRRHGIQKECARACGIIRNLARFARQQPTDPAVVQLTNVIAPVIELSQRRLESGDIDLRR
jgi:hypothetical protein